jgi:histidyl-tRNA synthetase
VADRLCADCRRRSDQNPLRVLDCKVPECREAMADAPSILDHLCNACREDFETVQTHLARLDIDFEVDKQLVRGLDYYNRTTFEMQTGALGAQSAVAGGGRYDGLVKMLGGPDLPATGFAIGFDRLAEICGLDVAAFLPKPDLFIAALGPAGQGIAFDWICELGSLGVRAEMDFTGKSLKSQMKQADRLGAAHVLILGDNEIARGKVLLRNMTSKSQESIPMEGIAARLKARFDRTA